MSAMTLSEILCRGAVTKLVRGWCRAAPGRVPLVGLPSSCLRFQTTMVRCGQVRRTAGASVSTVECVLADWVEEPLRRKKVRAAGA